MKLSERLEMVLSFVEPGESAADVGTDHGHVPVELVRRGIVKRQLRWMCGRDRFPVTTE